MRITFVKTTIKFSRAHRLIASRGVSPLRGLAYRNYTATEQDRKESGRTTIFSLGSWTSPFEKTAQNDDRSLNPEPAWPLIITRN
jgi:hypothetical protein